MSVSKEKIKTLRSILETENFYPFLCAFSNNDIDTVIDNLAKVINYVLTTTSDLTDVDYQEIIRMGVKYPTQGEYLIYSTNSYLDNITKLTGIRPAERKMGITRKLTLLDQNLSFFTSQHATYYPIYGTIKQAIEEGFSHPKTLYAGILKQPETDKRPVIVGESEQTYYRSILERRLKNLSSDYTRTGARTAKKVLKDIIGKDISLYFLPERYMEEEEITEDMAVSPFELRKINIPSRYTLLMICARNKRLLAGEKINIDDGGKYEKPLRVEKQFSSLKYCRYELVPITEKFIYTNEELSGDTEYDLDDLYGMHDTKGNRGSIKDVYLSERIRRIKASYDLLLEKRDGKYNIQNGRHRLLFLKYYYQSHYKDYTNPEHLKMLRDMVTVPALVDRTIEDPVITHYLIELQNQFENIQYIKTDIENDKFEIIVLLKGNAYYLRSKEDLINFYNLVSKKIFPKQYFFGENTNEELIPGEIIIAKLITYLKSVFFKLDLAAICTYIKTQHLEIAGQEINFDRINYRSLNGAYVTAHHAYQLENLRHEPESVFDKAKQKLTMYEEYVKQRKR